MLKRKNSRGVTLLELMLALTISIFLISFLFEIYIVAENNQSKENQLLSLKENQQILSHMLTQQIRLAGFVGCGKFEKTYPFYNHLNKKINFKSRIKAYTGNDNIPGTDALTLWHAGEETTKLMHTMENSSTLYVEHNLFSIGDEVVISDCTSIELFKIKDIELDANGMQKIITNAPLNKLYPIENTELSLFREYTYFIGRTNRLSFQKPINSFYRRDNSGHLLELIEGVDAMHIRYEAQNGEALEGLSDLTNVIGILFELRFTLNKDWYLYVALPH